MAQIRNIPSKLLQCWPGSQLITLPEQLNQVTRIDHQAECDPDEVGMTREGVERIWQRVEALYTARLHPSITLLIRRSGQIVLKRSIGCASGNAPGENGRQQAIDTDAPQCIFSASKVITALLVHKLVEDGKLELSDCVAEHIPEFGAHGKQNITVRDLLAHRAGVPFIPREHASAELLEDWDRIIKLICERPAHYPNAATTAYHALTSGYIAGELVRRVGDIEVSQALDEWLRKPLGCRYLTYGAEPAIREEVARNSFTGPPAIWPMSAYLKRIVSVPFKDAIDTASSDAFMSAVMPAGNIHASADDLGRVFEMLRNGGTFEGNQVLKPETIAEAVRPVRRLTYDRTLHVPIRYSAGFMLGENPFGIFGPSCGRAYGHLGFTSVLGWADPQRHISVAFLNTGKSVSPTGLVGFARVLGAIGRECSKMSI